MAKHKRGRQQNPRRDIVREFDRYFGDTGKLSNWQRLCEDLDLEGDFSSLTKCRKALKHVWVNIWDFLDALSDGTEVYKFRNQRELAEYTCNSEKFYPLKKAKEQGPVRLLLAHVR